MKDKRNGFLRYPPSAGSAGKDEGVGSLYGQSNFRTFYLASALACESGIQHIGKHCGLQAGGVRIYKEEKRLI